MRALTWQGRRSVSVEQVPDPTLQSSTDAIISVTSTAICGSDLHLYEVLGPFLTPGDVLGHEAMGMPVLELTTTGRRSGQRRSVMLTSPLTDNGRLVVVASPRPPTASALDASTGDAEAGP